jgi:hypothetical protein
VSNDAVKTPPPLPNVYRFSPLAARSLRARLASRLVPLPKTSRQPSGTPAPAGGKGARLDALTRLNLIFALRAERRGEVARPVGMLQTLEEGYADIARMRIAEEPDAAYLVQWR